MRIGLWIGLIPALAGAADVGSAQRMFDAKLSPTQRANVCFELRGNHEAEVIRAMSRALEDQELVACAADNLRIAGAAETLKAALGSANEQARAAAARELGSFHDAALLEPLSMAAGDANMLVASNALAALSEFRGPEVVPYLAALAKKGGMIGDMALDRVLQLDAGAALPIARALLESTQVPDKLYAMRTLGAAGNRSDLEALRKLAASKEEPEVQRSRGFGLMPPINLARAAQSAIADIESRER